MCKMSVYQTCQPLVKENLETHEQKSGDSAKNSEILLFFPDQTPFPSRELGTSLIPRAFELFLVDFSQMYKLERDNLFRLPFTFHFISFEFEL